MGCPQGTFSTNGEPCIPCLQGTISTAGFTSNSARTNCIACQAGFSSEPGGACVQCQGGSTARSGGLCVPCPAGNGDTTTEPGSCFPCPLGYSSDLGGICVNCPSGQFSFSGGLCTNCPAGYSSTEGSESCTQCAFGQVSISGDECVDRCQAGQAWSNLFQQCAICPIGTFSMSGDTSCTLCPPNTYSPNESSSCWSSNRIGGKMRVSTPFDEFYLPDWKHQIAYLLDSEVIDIIVLHTYSGSTIIDFEIEDPSEETMVGATSQIRALSGNEKMLLLYEWWNSGDERMDEFDYDVIDFKVFAENVNAEDDNDEVVQLFAPSDIRSMQFAPNPDNDNPGLDSGFYFDQQSLEIIVTVDSGSLLRSNSYLILLFSLLFFLFF